MLGRARGGSAMHRGRGAPFPGNGLFGQRGGRGGQGRGRGPPGAPDNRPPEEKAFAAIYKHIAPSNGPPRAVGSREARTIADAAYELASSDASKLLTLLGPSQQSGDRTGRGLQLVEDMWNAATESINVSPLFVGEYTRAMESADEGTGTGRLPWSTADVGTAPQLEHAVGTLVTFLVALTKDQVVNSPLGHLTTPITRKLATSWSMPGLVVALVTHAAHQSAAAGVRAIPIGSFRGAAAESKSLLGTFLVVLELLYKWMSMLGISGLDPAVSLSAISDSLLIIEHCMPWAANEAFGNTAELRAVKAKLVQLNSGLLRRRAFFAQQEAAQRRHEQIQQRLEVLEQMGALRISDNPDCGPGALNGGGPRHDNDKEDIREISVVPTPQELLCPLTPYLPHNKGGGSPHMVKGTPEALADLHFRLLRHDLVQPLCTSVQAFARNEVMSALSHGRGRDAARHGSDDIRLDVYRNASVKTIEFDPYLGMLLAVEVQGPAFLDRATQGMRRHYFETTKRLSRGTLVTLLWPTTALTQSLCDEIIAANDHRRLVGLFRVSMLVVASERGRSNQIRVLDNNRIRVMLQPSDMTDTALVGLAMRDPHVMQVQGQMVLLRSDGSFFAYRPVLEALQKLPAFPAWFSETCIADLPGRIGWEGGHVTVTVVARGGTASQPNRLGGLDRKVDLTKLLPKDAVLAEGDRTTLSAISCADARAFPTEAAARVLGLDESQGQALRSMMCDRLSLIQGPPGCGKTFIGVKAVLALVKSNAVKGPIMCLCFTNHALDQFLEALLDAGVTSIVRLGRPKSPRLETFTLLQLSIKTRDVDMRGFSLASARKSLENATKKLGASVKALRGEPDDVDVVAAALSLGALGIHQSLDSALGSGVDQDGFPLPLFTIRMWLEGASPASVAWEEVVRFVEVQEREAERRPGAHVARNRFDLLDLAEDADVEVVGKKGKKKKGKERPATWAERMERMGWEPDWISAALEYEAAYHQERAAIPTGASPRPLDVLLALPDAFVMSRDERRLVHAHLVEEARRRGREELSETIREFHEAKSKVDAIHEQKNERVLQGVSVIGMTTTFCAAHKGLLAAVTPRVVVVEEAGEVLESHVLTSMHGQVEQLVLIGDHEQLRPKVEGYELKVESGRGYNLDLSLFERLALGVEAGAMPQLSMVTLRQQWRMRPEIADLIRRPIYPLLQDAPRVREYPAVAGMAAPLLWMTHSEPESGQGSHDDSKSKTNAFEADLVVALAEYLTMHGYVGQGRGSRGEIAILTPYVGQLLAIRNRLQGKFVVTVNDRDMEEVARAEEQDAAETEAGVSATVARTQLGQSVRVATVDNFQGEEAEVVIVSLVRSNERKNIRFLRTQNRANVMLSRARHGMYIVSNAECIRGDKNSKFWRHVIETIEGRGLLRDALPLVCRSHGNVTEVASAEEMAIKSPMGGCMHLCQERMPCGHLCVSQCHAADAQHQAIVCPEPCAKLHEGCQHPCNRPCGEPCGPCTVKIEQVTLVCGHVARGVDCAVARAYVAAAEGAKEALLPCKETITVRQIPEIDGCGHEMTVSCAKRALVNTAGRDAVLCSHGCEATLPCGHPCRGKCGACKRNKHPACARPCERILPCGHTCGAACHQHKHAPEERGAQQVQCPPCTQKCPSRCSHSPCSHACTAPCTPCIMPCDWA